MCEEVGVPPNRLPIRRPKNADKPLTVPFRLVSRTYQDAEGLAEEARIGDDGTTWHYYQRLLQTANGRYHVRQTNLNDAVNQGATAPLRPMRFRAWLEQTWGAAEV
jgi:hypothetical protein